jgi:hypothetical protein
MNKCSSIDALPNNADLGIIMQGYGELAQKYGLCAMSHNNLIDYLEVK